MKRTRAVLLIYVALVSGVANLPAATYPKFQPLGSGDVGLGRYVVTLAEDTVADDLGALKRELTSLYGARIEPTASSDVQQFTATMMPSRARLLSADPRVSEVAEVSLEMPATPWASGPSSRRFTPQPSGYGDNGQSGTYTYDGVGNITAIGADTYRYDTAQRLVSSVTRGVQEDYSYDAFGNRKCATGAVNCLGQTTCAQIVTVDSNTNHIATINGASVTYDDAGNIKTIAAISGNPGATYTYDGTGMMAEATVGSDDRQFLYTADDERIAIKQGESWTWTVRDLKGKVLREFTSLETGPNLAMTHWQWTKDYIWRDGLLLATVTPNGTLHYHLDHLGTPRLVTDANGVKVAEHAYYPFGAEINVTPHETPEEAMKFTGHERDVVAGDGHTLDYMHARYDNANLGRFLSVDPEMNVDKNKTQPQAWNRYAYVMNNPMNLTDPTGRCFWDVCVGEALVGTAILTAATAYVVAPSAVVHGKTNGQVLLSTAIGGFQALGRGLGALIPGRQPTSLPPPPPPTIPSRPTTPGTQATTGVNPAVPIQSQVVNTSQGPVTIPSDYTSRPADNGKGTIYQAPGATGIADMIRVMDPTTRYPTGYVVILNSQGQPVTIDGKPGSRPETHLPIEEQKQQ